MNTAQSQSAWDRIMAPSLSGKNLYMSPHTNPATSAAIISMKLNLARCTRPYTRVVTIKPVVGFQRLEKLF